MILQLNFFCVSVSVSVLIVLIGVSWYEELLCSCLLPCSSSPLRPSSMIFNFIDSPNGTLDILHAHEALVEGQIVPNGVLLNHAHNQRQSHKWFFSVDGDLMKREKKEKIQCRWRFVCLKHKFFELFLNERVLHLPFSNFAVFSLHEFHLYSL